MRTETNPTITPRRRRRRSWTTGLVVLVTLAIVITLKATSLNGLPDLGEPFDIEAFSRPIPDETNAFVLYKRAFAKLGKEPKTPTFVWSTADIDQRRWFEENREALEIWRKGTARPDALYISPKTFNIMTLLPVIQGMRSFARLAILEGTRLQDEGDLNGALDWYLAVLRSSRHCGRRGVAIERLVGIAIGSMASSRLLNWAVDPKVDATMLRRALDTVLEAETMTPMISDMVKCEYIGFCNTIADPAFEDPSKIDGNAPKIWSTGPGYSYFRAVRSIKREPERSRRVFRLITANWLAYCDRPRSKRPPFANLAPSPKSKTPAATTGFALYVPEPSAPESVKALSPDELASWFYSTVYAEMISSPFGGLDKAAKRDESTFANLRITLANELYLREKGKYPEAVEDLVGP